MKIKRKILIGLFTSTLAILGCAPKSMVVKTPQEPCLTPSGENNFIVCENFNFKVDHKTYEVPKGFVTDLATIPNSSWIMRAVFKNKFISPIVIHDYLYACKSPFSRLEIDSIFYNGLLDEGVEDKKAKAIYYLLVLIGWHYYSGDKQCTIGTE